MLVNYIHSFFHFHCPIPFSESVFVVLMHHPIQCSVFVVGTWLHLGGLLVEGNYYDYDYIVARLAWA